MDSRTVSEWLVVLIIAAPLLVGSLGLVGLLGSRRHWFDKNIAGKAQSHRRTHLPRWRLTISSIISLTGTLLLVVRADQLPISMYFLLHFYIDALSVYFLLLINVVTVFACWYLERPQPIDSDLGEGENREIFHAVFGVFQATLLLIPLVDDLFVLWLLIELTTAISVILLLQSTGSSAAEAGLEYFFITIPALIFAFLGMTLVAIELPAGTSLSWSTIMNLTNRLNPQILSLAFVCILLGYGAKAGLAPLHTWLPDAHGEAPVAMSSMLSSVMVKLALLAILRWAAIVNRTLGSSLFTNSLFLGFAMVSLIVATLAILKHNRFKRVLAWHTLEHMGIIMFGLGLGTPLAVFGALLHAFNHALTKELTFLAFGNVRSHYKQSSQPIPAFAGASSRSNIPVRSSAASKRGKAPSSPPESSQLLTEDGITGALKMTPISGGLLALGGLSLVGSPPFNLFLSEVIILWAALGLIVDGASGWIIATTAIFIISITLVFGGLVSHLSKILLDRAPDTLKAAFLPDKISSVWPLVILFALIVVFGVTIPALGPLNLPNVLHQSACIVQGEGRPCR